MARSKTSNISFGARTDPSPPPVFDDAEPESELSPGRVLSQRYRLLKRLGSGGMGVVFHALDLDLNEDVALKVLLPELLRDKATAERFRNEVKLARKIAHSGVCRVFDVGEDGALRFLTMELIEGRTLRQLLSAEEIDGERAYSLLLQVADGLSAVHERGIVHRDLKPENVMVRPDGQTVLVDFGLARDSFLPGASSGGIAGTPRYMSPEQLRGGRLDVRSDVFSFGVMAFEILSGRAPFGDGAVAEVATAILRDAPLRFEGVGFSEARAQGLRVFFEKALAKAPEQRFGSAGELRSALEGAWAERARQAAGGQKLHRSKQPRRLSLSAMKDAPIARKILALTRKRWRQSGWLEQVSAFALACAVISGISLAFTQEHWKIRRWFEALPMSFLEKSQYRQPVIVVRGFEDQDYYMPWWERFIEKAEDGILAGLQGSRRFKAFRKREFPFESIPIPSPFVDLFIMPITSGQEAPNWELTGSIIRSRSGQWPILKIELNEIGTRHRIEIQLATTSYPVQNTSVFANRSDQTVARRALTKAYFARYILFDELVELAIDQNIISRENGVRNKLWSFYEATQQWQSIHSPLERKYLLDEVLRLDPDCVLALIERAILVLGELGASKPVDSLDSGLYDLDRALALRSGDPRMHVINCLVNGSDSEWFHDWTSDEVIKDNINECLSASEVSPNSFAVQQALIRLYENTCDANLAMESRGLLLNNIEEGGIPYHHVTSVLYGLAKAALKEGQLDIADRASRYLLAHSSASAAINEGYHFLRGAVLLQLTKNDPYQLLEARIAFVKQLTQTIDAESGRPWYRAGAIRGLIRLAKQTDTVVESVYRASLKETEENALQTNISPLVDIYELIDPESALQLHMRLGRPQTLSIALSRATLLHEMSQDNDARRLLSRYSPEQQWQQRCMDEILSKLAR